MAASPRKPTVVLIPGSFINSAYYTPTIQPLRDAGVTVHLLDPPCYYSKKPGPPPTMYDDAFFIASFVSKLADASEEIVLVAHSYGGAPASESLAGLSLLERQKHGKPGGVVRLAYITAVVPKVGNGLADTMIGGIQVPLEVDEDGWMFQPQPSATAEICCNSLSPEQGLKEAEKMGQHSSAAFASTLTYPGYKDVPVSWFLCEDDRCVTPAVQETAIADIEASWKGTERESKRVDVTRVKCDHIPTASAREELVSWLEGLVEKGGRD